MKNSIIVSILCLLTGVARAATCVSDGSPASVQACVNAAASNGDTITLPAGTFPWPTGVTINSKGITIQGQTTTNSDTGVCNDQTILVDNITGNNRFFNGTNILAPQAFRITGITFKGGTQSGAANGIISVGGSTNPAIAGSNAVRLDHLHITGGIKRGHGIEIYSGITGVADHLVFDQLTVSNPQNFQNRVDNGSYPYGDNEWAQPAGWGGPNFFFWEDCYINNDTGAHFSAGYGIDAIRGSKFVVRHCHLFNIEILCHGMEGDRNRGGRAQEIYNNDYHLDYAAGLDGIRSGSLLTHDNTYIGVKPSGYGLQAYRRIFGYGNIWKGATGANAWDYNSTEADKSHIDGHLPYLFESGTCSSGSGANIMVDTSKTWTVNQWKDFELSRPSTGSTWLIASNTATTLTLIQWGDPCCIQTWTTGQAYEIRYVLKVLDQPCSGQADPIVGDTPTPTWTHQVREPCYSWNNVHPASGGHVNWNPRSPELLEGRDYFTDTPLSGYTPYTYPHPLVGTPGLPNPPTNLQANAVSSTQINLAWVDNSTNEDGFKIERSTDNVQFNQIGTVTTNVVQYPDTNLTPSTTYYYRVRAFNVTGNSAYSNVANATTLPVPTPTPTASQTPTPTPTPGVTPTPTPTATPVPTPTPTPTPTPVTTPIAPSNLVATAVSQTEIDLAWIDNSDNETGFKIDRSSDGVNFNQIHTLTANSVFYADQTVPPATREWYRVRAYNTAGNSAYSNVSDATTFTPTPTPTPTATPVPTATPTPSPTGTPTPTPGNTPHIPTGIRVISP